MALVTTDGFPSTPTRALRVEAAHPMRSVLVTVFALKIMIAGFLLACVSMAPPVAAESPYQISN